MAKPINDLAKKNLLLIFTRNPELGKVKKRLAASIGENAALEVYNFLLKKTAQITRDLPVIKRVFYSEYIQKEDFWDEFYFDKKRQTGDELGERMENAFHQGFTDGFEKIVIIGSDLFELEKKDLEMAFLALDTSDFVIGPAQDGGYWLLGMKKLNSAIFRNKTWSSDYVLQDTLENLKNESVTLLETRNDVDELKDIEHHPAFNQFLNKK